jgi:glutaredoxin 3
MHSRPAGAIFLQPTNLIPAHTHGIGNVRGPLKRLSQTPAAPAILYEVMSHVTVYTTEPCSFCVRVKGILTSLGVEFDEVNLSKDPVGRAELAQRTGMMSFPQVTVGAKLIGGFKELQAAAESGDLDELLAFRPGSAGSEMGSPA